MILFRIRVGQFQFTPSLTSSIVTLLLIMVFVYLGSWQIRRGEEKKEIIKRFESTDNRLTVQGRFLNEFQILLDNQIFEKQVGYQVLVPFKVKDDNQKDNTKDKNDTNSDNKIIIVNRGWIPLGKSRNEIPKIQPILGEVILTGRMVVPSKNFQLVETEAERLYSNEKKIFRIQKIDFEELKGYLFLDSRVRGNDQGDRDLSDSLQLESGLLQIEKDSPYTFKVIPHITNMTPERHLGYALQWFTMALVTFIYFMVMNTRRWRKKTD